MEIKYSRTKKCVEFIIYVLLSVVMMLFYFKQASNLAEKMILSVFCVLFLMAGIKALRTFIENRLIFKVDESGITDYTKANDPLYLPWSKVLAVSISNQNYSANVNVMAGLKRDDGEMMFLNLSMDGFNYGRKEIFKIYDCIHEVASANNPKIVFKEAKGIRDATVSDKLEHAKEK